MREYIGKCANTGVQTAHQKIVELYLIFIWTLSATRIAKQGHPACICRCHPHDCGRTGDRDIFGIGGAFGVSKGLHSAASAPVVASKLLTGVETIVLLGSVLSPAESNRNCHQGLS